MIWYWSNCSGTASQLTCPHEWNDSRGDDGHRRYVSVVRIIPPNLSGTCTSLYRFTGINDDYGTVWRVLEESQKVQLRDKARWLTECQSVPPEQWLAMYRANLQNLLKVSPCAIFFVTILHLDFQKLNVLSADSATLMKLAVLKARAERLRLDAFDKGLRGCWNKIDKSLARREHTRPQRGQHLVPVYFLSRNCKWYRMLHTSALLSMHYCILPL